MELLNKIKAVFRRKGKVEEKPVSEKKPSEPETAESIKNQGVPRVPKVKKNTEN